MRTSVILLLVSLSACGSSAVERDADRAEKAIVTKIAYDKKYGAGSADDSFVAVVAGRGMLADLAVLCGGAEVDGARVRAMQLGGPNSPQEVVREGLIGQDPAVFDELWRRAGCAPE